MQLAMLKVEVFRTESEGLAYTECARHGQQQGHASFGVGALEVGIGLGYGHDLVFASLLGCPGAAERRGGGRDPALVDGVAEDGHKKLMGLAILGPGGDIAVLRGQGTSLCPFRAADPLP